MFTHETTAAIGDVHPYWFHYADILSALSALALHLHIQCVCKAGHENVLQDCQFCMPFGNVHSGFQIVSGLG